MNCEVRIFKTQVLVPWAWPTTLTLTMSFPPVFSNVLLFSEEKSYKGKGYVLRPAAQEKRKKEKK
jgi:hypothetical protein